MSEKLSIVIITKNEEKNIERCLKSVQWADEIVVVDNGSTDRTPGICRQYATKVILQPEWLGFGPLKQVAVNAATHNWILSIDSDEEVSEGLKSEIQTILQRPQFHGYRIKRQSFYLGKPIRFCGWQRDYPLRLFDRRFGNFNDSIVHESVRLTGHVSKLEQPIFHYTYPTVRSHIERMNRYTDLGLSKLIAQQKSSSLIGAVARGLAKFIKMYFLQQGFRDGRIGFVLCYNSAFGVYLKYLKLWESQR